MANNSSLLALTWAAIPISDHRMRQHRAEPLRSVACAVRHDLSDKAFVIVVEGRLGRRPKESERMNMPVQPGLGVRSRRGTGISREPCFLLRT